MPRVPAVPLALALLLLLGALSGVAAQADATSAAGFLVDDGEGEPRYVVVTFTGESIAAIDLLREADLGAVTVDFGGLGEAVCEIDRTGCEVDACRVRLCQTGDPESPFWQLWGLDEDGAWALSTRGASDVELTHGDVVAWAWTGVPPELPAVDWSTLADLAGAPVAVGAGEVSGEPAVYVSGVATRGDDSDLGGTIGSIIVIGAIGAAGLLLARWQRRRAERAA